jgi:hypothetical protein
MSTLNIVTLSQTKNIYEYKNTKRKVLNYNGHVFFNQKYLRRLHGLKYIVKCNHILMFSFVLFVSFESTLPPELGSVVLPDLFAKATFSEL